MSAVPQARHVVPARRRNPLTGMKWGTYEGPADPAWPPYAQSTGTTHKMLAKIALTPKAKWFGPWLSPDEIASHVTDYIDNTTHGNPNVLVQMTFFDMQPWEREACTRLPTQAERVQYRTWIRRAAAAIGNTHTLIIQQPDGPVALCAPHGSHVYEQLLAWATKTLSALPNTTVYIEGGSADWLHGKVGREVSLLVRDGIAHARGFELGTTHFDSVKDQIAFGSRVVAGLARRGYPGRHFVVDTGDNGRPFTGSWYWQRHAPGSNFNNARRCKTRSETHCVTLGIPPTTDVANAEWGLPAWANRLARQHVDAYLWVSRPWITPVTEKFDMNYALRVVRTAAFPIPRY
ncbi:MAG TPA: glycoside hydrolase family 6 protein [Jatrophihabitans sp.]|nr:glycoside hydrolase family 6 protein [Jatrophihabitans sp.]